MKKVIAFLIAVLLLLSGCVKTPEENTEYISKEEFESIAKEQQAKISELEDKVRELDALVKNEYFTKYIKPIVYARVLELEWETPEQLFNTEVQLVGHFAEGFSSPTEWSKIYAEGHSKEDLTTYIPQDIAESIIERYFGIPGYRLKELSRQYNAEREAYEYYGARDLGTEGITVKDIRNEGNNIVITCEFKVSDELSKCSELTLALDGDGNYKYISNHLI